MSDKIGPTFASELAAAGAFGTVSWDTTTGVLTRCLGVSDADFAKAETVLAKHDPTKPGPVVYPTIFSPRDFMGLFTADEQKALFTARQTNVQIDMFITLAMAGNVDVSNPEVVTDINAVAAAKLVTADRAKQILAGQPPVTSGS